MPELIAKSACDGLLPVTMGSVVLSEIAPAVLTSIAPFKGQSKALSEALKAAHGMAMPAANRATGTDNARCIWFGRAHALLVGPEPDAGLARFAAVTDQSDAWTVVALEGTGAVDVLARLVPMDLRSSAFKTGHTARTDLMHMSASITRVSANAFQIMAFRSMAKTLVHDLKTAMEGVAARG